MGFCMSAEDVAMHLGAFAETCCSKLGSYQLETTGKHENYSFVSLI